MNETAGPGAFILKRDIQLADAVPDDFSCHGLGICGEFTVGAIGTGRTPASGVAVAGTF